MRLISKLFRRDQLAVQGAAALVNPTQSGPAAAENVVELLPRRGA